MSDTGDSDDSSIEEPYLKNRRRVGLVGTSSDQISNNNKRKIVMKIEFDDSDDDDYDISCSDADNDDFSDDDVKPSTSNRKRLLQSSDDDTDSSNDSKIIRKNLRGRKIDKNRIISEEEEDNDSLPTYPIPNNTNNNNNADDGFNSDSSSNEALEKCPICLFTFRNQEIGVPNICEHKYCALCIEEWSKNVQTCPIDRQEFKTINVYDKFTTIKNNKNIIREIKVIKQINNEEQQQQNSTTNDDATFCEICQLSNREDVMLLCDGCNHGFHIFCLTPQLEQIPDGFWYCDNCFDSDENDSDLADDLNALYEDIRDLGIPETRLRITEVRQPRILRTRQSERIRATIVARTRSSGNSNNHNNEIDITAPSTSRAIIEHSANGAGRRRIGQTTTTTTRTTLTTTTTTRKLTKQNNVLRKRKTIRRRRRKTKKPRSRTYVVEYDVNNFDDKFALKTTTKKYIRKRRTKKRIKGRRKSKLTNAEKIVNQQNGKKKKYTGEQLGIKRLNKYERPINSSQSLSIFGNANDLEYFSDSDNNLQHEFNGGGGGDSGGGSTAVQTSIRLGHFSNLRHRKIIKPNIQPPVSSGPVDLLSNLLDMQDRFLNATRQDQINAIRIGSDGSINFGENLNINQTETTPNSEKCNDTTSKGNEVNSNDINQAPMFPWNNNNQRNSGGQGGNNRGSGGGGGGGYNNRFNNQSNYRNSGGGGGGNYRHSTGGMGGNGNNNNFRFQMNQNNNNNNPNFTPNYRNRFNRNNQQRNRRNENENESNSNNNNEQNPNSNNSLLNRQLLYSPTTEYNDDNSNQSENLVTSPTTTTTSPQQQEQQRLSTQSRIITSEEVTNSILGLKPSSSLNTDLGDNINDFNLNRNIPPPLLGPPLNVPPPLNFTPLHYPTLSQSGLTPSLNHPPPLMGSLIGPLCGSMAEPIGSMSGLPITSMTGPTICPMPIPTIGSMSGPTICPMSVPTIGALPGATITSMMIDFSQPPPPPPPPPLPETIDDQNNSMTQNNDTSLVSTTIIGPQPLAPPPWNENLFKLATDYCDDDDNDDDCPNFSVYSAASLQVANSTNVQNIHGDKAQEDEFDADEDLVQLGDDDDIPNSIDNSENRNRIEFKIIGPKLYKPTADNKSTTIVDEKNKKVSVNRDKTNTSNNNVTEQDKTKRENQIENIEDVRNDSEKIKDKKDDEDEETTTCEKENGEDEIKSNENPKQNIIEETNNDDDDDDDGSSTNELTPVTYNDLEKPTNETDTDTTTNTPSIRLKNKKGVLELYDDSDWEELNIEREQLKQKIAMEGISLIGPQLEKDDEYINKDDMDLLSLENLNKLQDTNNTVIDDEIADRSYTPCLDEKNEHDDIVSPTNSPPIVESSTSLEKKQHHKDESRIEGIETELISDGEIVVGGGGEQGKNNVGKKKDDKKKNDDKNVIGSSKNSNLKKSRRNDTFKKITKNQRERNYRVERTDAQRERPPLRHSRSRSHSNDKENKERDKNRRSRERRNNSRNRFRRIRRKEIVRYNVRNIINQPRTYKDRYGRDTSRPARSRSRSRPIRISKSRSRSHIRSPPVRSRSRSSSSVRKNVRSFSISPSPLLSPQGYRGRRAFSPRHIRRFTPMGRRRSRSPLRIRSRSRSNSISERVAERGGNRRRHPSNNHIRQRSLSNSSKSPQQACTPTVKRADGSIVRNRKRKRSKERKKRKTRRRNSSISSPPLQQQQMIIQHSKRLSRPRERASPNIIAEPVTGGGGGNRKKKSRRSRSKSPPIIDRMNVQNRGWTTSPEYNPNEKPNDVSWTPPIQSLAKQQHSEFRVMFKEPRKKRDKKRKNDKRKDRNSGVSNNRKEKRNKNKEKTTQAAPSKEVFASGDNILVSVSFNKDHTTGGDGNTQPQQQTTVVTLPPTRAEIVSNRRQSSIERQRSRRNKDQQSTINQSGLGGGVQQKRQRKHRKINIKPVAIIDLDRSPFQVIQVPRDIIVLTDSENENDHQRLNADDDVNVGDAGSRCDRRSSSVGLLEQQQQLQQQLQQQEQQHRENSINRSVEMNDDDDDNNNNNHHHHHHENGHHRLREMDNDDDDDDETNNNKTPERNNDRSDLSNLPDDSYAAIQQLGPKTPPEPPIVKFALSTKYRIKPRNPLHEEHERDDQQELEEELRERERERERLEMEEQQLQQQQLQQQQQQLLQKQQQEEEQEMEEQQQQQQNKIGPNTPPESGPCSPDVYDPFDPTKSPSASPESPEFLEGDDEMPSHSSISDKDLTNNNESVIDREQRKLDKNNINPADLVKALMNTSQDLSKLKKSDQQQQYINNNNVQMQSVENDKLTIEEQQQPQQSKTIQVLSNVLLSLGKSHHHIPLISSPPQSSSSLKQQQQQSQGFMGITKLPQNMSTNKISNLGGSNNYRHNGSSNDDIINEIIDSPYSPCSDDFDDLFDPPPESTNNRNRNKNTSSKNTHKYYKTVEIFDNLFGSTSPVGVGNSNRLPLPGLGGFTSSSTRKQRTKMNKKTSVKVGKIPGIGKIDEEQIKIYDDLPNSAVELQVKDKFLRKLNRQERVVEEVKLVLKPHYNRKHITKDEYKEILRRSVPKICHSKSGEINPKKIHNLIEAYVRKFRQRNKLGIGMNAGQVSTAVKCAAYLKKL